MIWQTSIEIKTSGRGLLLVTDQVERAISSAKLSSGLLNVFIHHTSASLLIQENADPSARGDLEKFLDVLVPEGESWHRHLDEGPDDTVSHMRAAITPTSLMIPVRDGALDLGRWQGLYLWEHRRAAHLRKLTLTLIGL